MANPGSFPDSSSAQTFAFTSDGIYLAANTTYHVVFDTSTSNGGSALAITSASGEDAGAAAGWSIADNRSFRAFGSTGAYSTQAASSHLIALTGTQAAVGCSTADTTDGSYEVPYDWALKPRSLTDGNTFRLLFVSSTQRDGSSTDIADYNTHVQTAAKAGHTAITDPCGDLFKAVASTSAVDARANTDTESSDTAASVWWLGGTKAADDYADFWDGTWDSYGRRTEAGAGGASNLVYTGSDDDGTKHNTDFLGSSAGWRIGDINTGQNPISQSSDSTGGTGTRSLLGMSPLFKVEQRPTVSISATSVSAGEVSTVTLTVVVERGERHGADLVIPVRVKSAGTTVVFVGVFVHR